MTSQRLRDKLIGAQVPGGYGLPDVSVAALRTAISSPGVAPDGSAAPSWLSSFKLLQTNPDRAIAEQNMDLPILVNWCKSFHILQPITDVTAIAALCNRLDQHGMGIDWARVQELKPPATLMRCSCHVFQHYGFCLEVCLWAMDFKLFVKIPATLDPVRIASRKGGRTKKAVPGQALVSEASEDVAPKSKGGKRARPSGGSRAPAASVQPHRKQRIVDDSSDDD